jgi:hypothetical protein
MRAGYSEEQLVQNRVATLVFGGAEAERRAWAEEAAALGSEAALLEARDEAALRAALARTSGVVYVPEADKVAPALQRELVRVLKTKEERPKFVLGLGLNPDTALSRGLLREDLHFAVGRSVVDLGAAPIKAAVKKRRAKKRK